LIQPKTAKQQWNGTMILIWPRRLQKNNGDITSAEKQKKKLLSLGSNQKPSGCLDLEVITAERATNCATEDNAF
jgi:hypothetical protein